MVEIILLIFALALYIGAIILEDWRDRNK